MSRTHRIFRHWHTLAGQRRRSTPLHNAIAELAEQMLRIASGFGDMFGRFQCAEIEAFATVLAVGGQPKAAAHVVALHAEYDDEDCDAHAHLREMINRDRETSPAFADTAGYHLAEQPTAERAAPHAGRKLPSCPAQAA